MQERLDRFDESEPDFRPLSDQFPSVLPDQLPSELPDQLPKRVNRRAAFTSVFMRAMLAESVSTLCSGRQSPLWMIFATRRADTTVVTAITTLVTVVVLWKQTQAIAMKKNSNLYGKVRNQSVGIENTHGHSATHAHKMKAVGMLKMIASISMPHLSDALGTRYLTYMRAGQRHLDLRL